MFRTCLVLTVSLLPSASLFGSEGQIDYEGEVKPVFKARCYSCHGALKQESGLRLDSGALIRRGGDSGPGVTVGKVQGSLLVERITNSDESLRMPPEGEALSSEQIGLIKSWIAQGARSPDNEQPEEDAREYWAYKKALRATPPAVKNAEWVRNPIDAFIAAEHERHALEPLPPAEKHILLRRVYLDLIGLPPTRNELHAFLANESPDAYQEVVDRLLDSQHYGERWGRHWMDVWRYSDWYGRRQVGDVRNSYPHIWRWRDWIIQSLNEDKGYDQMVREMLAADELYPSDDTRMPALGFIVRNWFSLNYDTWKQDLVEHTGKAFLGLRINCAHCHDHKYDPITQEEYFKFRAFFEPLELRHDRVPGGPALTKYIRYKAGSGAALQPIQDGLPRVYDLYHDEKTFMYRLGDTRHRFDRPPVSPAAPALLGGDKLTIEPVELPPAAWYPALKSFVQEDEISRRQEAIKSAEVALAKAVPAAESLARTSAETQLASAHAELKAIRARIAADKLRHESKAENTDDVERAAFAAEREAQLAGHRNMLAEAEELLAEYRHAGNPDAKKVQQSEQDAAAAREAIARLEQAGETVSNDYTPLGPEYPKTSTGRRRALAEWITNRDNPLAARVAVNHIWMRHFGRPLVESVFDFGRAGKRPTHPGLLDWLAVELMESGWSMKHLHRLIVTSRTYQLSSRPGGSDHPNYAIDKDNRFWWKFDRRRLEAEIIRDSMLHLSGQLDPALGGPEIDPSAEVTSRRRSLYFAIYPEAGGTMRFLTLFDPPDPGDCYRRSDSIMPQQALAMSNSVLSLNQGRLLADVLSNELGSSGASDADFVIALFEQVLARSPTSDEQQSCLEFLTAQRSLYAAASPAELNVAAPKDTVAAAAVPEQRARESLVRTLLNHTDFITLH